LSIEVESIEWYKDDDGVGAEADPNRRTNRTGGKHEHELHQATSDESGRRGNEWLTDRADSNADRRRVHGRVEGEESDKVRRLNGVLNGCF